MNILKTVILFGLAALLAGNVQAEEKSTKQKYAEKVKSMEKVFFEASRNGKTIKGIFVEGNSLFNGTTAPQDRSQDKPYDPSELMDAKSSAERNSKVFLLAQDGTLFYPTARKGQRVSPSIQSHRMPRVLTPEQKAKGLFTWSTMVPLVGREVEVYGEVYPGYAGVKGIYIKYIAFEGEYIVGKN